MHGSNSLPIRIVAAVLFLAASAALLLMGSFAEGRSRRIFFFPSSASLSDFSEHPVMELRYLNSEGRDPLTAYLSDYLLGSSGQERAQPFASECSLNRCFVRGNAAYIELSASNPEKTLADPLFAYKCDLFRKNVFTNFENIDTIYLYFDGVEVYAEKH